MHTRAYTHVHRRVNTHTLPPFAESCFYCQWLLKPGGDDMPKNVSTGHKFCRGSLSRLHDVMIRTSLNVSVSLAGWAGILLKWTKNIFSVIGTPYSMASCF